jgi:REP element-mobilizing transposase RayT
MPHWRLVGSVYFVTWRLSPSQAKLTEEERGVIISALRHFDGSRYELYACVVMDDHVHALVKPLGNYQVERIAHFWKSFTAHQFQKEGAKEVPIWQEEYFDRIVRDEKKFLDKAQYILNNPFKIWPDLAVYPWVWVKEDLNS